MWWVVAAVLMVVIIVGAFAWFLIRWSEINS